MVLADEPTGNLDSAATLEVLRLFDDLRSTGQMLVIVTYDSRIAATPGWRAFRLASGCTPS